MLYWFSQTSPSSIIHLCSNKCFLVSIASHHFAIAQQVESSDPKDKKKWRRVAEKAQVQAAEVNQKLDKVIGSCPNSRVEVGSLEDVIEKMGSDKKGTWSNVVLVRPGVIKTLRDQQVTAVN